MSDQESKKDLSKAEQNVCQEQIEIDQELFKLIEEKEESVADEELEADEDGAKLRVFTSSKVMLTLSIVAILTSLYHIYALVLTFTKPMVIYTIHWAIGLVLIFIFYPTSAKSSRKRINLFDVLLMAGVLAAAVYVLQDPVGLDTRHVYFQPSQLDIILGGFAIFASLEAGRRTIGWGLPLVSIGLLAYAMFGQHLPDFWASKGYSLIRVISHTFSLDGLFGTAIKMSAVQIFMLTLFGAFLYVCGTGDMFMRFAASAFGSRRGGPAKISIIGSGLFGSISGSAVANVVGTGIFTIPLMKKTGYRPEFAAAVEAVASTGGQIMPPVMGSGAFIMAEMLGVSYGSVALAALLPALLYYFGLYVAVDCEAARCDLRRMDTSTLEKASQIIKKGWYQLFPVLVLVICLAVFRMTITRAALLASVSCILASSFKKETRLSLKEILRALELGFMRSLSIIAACACAGIAIAAITLTGLGLKISIVVSSMAGNSLILALLFSALATIILGMGLPTVAAYVVSASVLAGSLVQLGIPPLVAHFFLFYFSILSQITPPVALAAYAAGNIASANPNAVGFTAVRLGLVAFFLPFFFVYGPALLGVGSGSEIALAAVTAVIGVFCFTVAQFGFFRGDYINMISRVLLMVSALCMVIPGAVTDLIGFVGIVIGMLMHKPVRDLVLMRKAA